MIIESSGRCALSTLRQVSQTDRQDTLEQIHRALAAGVVGNCVEHVFGRSDVFTAILVRKDMRCAEFIAVFGEFVLISCCSVAATGAVRGIGDVRRSQIDPGSFNLERSPVCIRSTQAIDFQGTLTESS